MDERCQKPPLFTFGVIADIQYADIDDGCNYNMTRKRYYRGSLRLLANALRSWQEAAVRPEFILQLGDVIDGFNRGRGSQRALDAVLTELDHCPLEVHHVWGNHEFYNFTRSELLRSRLNSTLGAERSYGGARAGGDIYAYHFSPHPGFRFVVLDGFDLSLLGRDESSDQYKKAFNLVTRYNPNDDLNCPADSADVLDQRFVKFNGGFSPEQLDWLRSVLLAADEKEEKVTVVGHLPVHIRSTTPICLAWNYEEMLEIIQAHRSVVCFIAGHDHDGGYHWDRSTGVHHLTLEGVIETPPDSDAFGTISVYEDRMTLKGAGRIQDRECVFRFCEKDTDL